MRTWCHASLGSDHALRTGRAPGLNHKLRELADRDASFLDRFAALPKRGRNRRYLARSREDLFPGSPHLAQVDSYVRELKPGSSWWVDVNLSRSAMERVIRMACEVAGLRYGTDLRVRLGQDS